MEPNLLCEGPNPGGVYRPSRMRSTIVADGRLRPGERLEMALSARYNALATLDALGIRDH